MYKNRIQIIFLDEIEDYLTFISEIFLKPSRYILKKLSTFNADKNKRVYENKSQINQDALIQKYHELELEFNKNKIGYLMK